MYSKLINRIEPSATLQMAQRAAQLKAEGVDVISLCIGEPDFPTPQHIKEAAQRALAADMTHYTPIDGLPELKQAIVNKLSKENGLQYAADQILVSTGAKQAICNAVLALVEAGDEVIVPAPYWISYPQIVRMAGGTPVIVDTKAENNYCLTANELRNSITEHTRMLILCSPSNPTGCVYSKQQLQELAAVIADYPNLYVLSDEIYEHIRYEGEYASLAQFSELKNRVIVVNGVSKAYAMTGWRIGWMAAEKSLVAACKKLQGQYTSCASSVSQMAALEAYIGDQSCVAEMREQFRRRRDLVLKMLSEVPNISFCNPQGAFYVFADFGAYVGEEKMFTTTAQLVEYLLETAHVAVLDGSTCGADGCIRISYAASEEELTEAMRRICCAIKKLVD